MTVTIGINALRRACLLITRNRPIPFARAVRGWGLADLAALVNRMRRLWLRHGGELERPCTDEEFMALYERFPAFDALDDCFVEREEEFTLGVARYVEAHAADFVTIAD